MVDTSSFHPRQQKGDKRSPARFWKSFGPSQKLEHAGVGLGNDHEGAFEATSHSWKPQFAGWLTAAKTGLRKAIEGLDEPVDR